MKLHIQDYLSTHTLKELSAAFAIVVRRHPEFHNLVMFKYSQIDSPMAEPIVQECRGIILDESRGWSVVSYPFNKFFNYGEPNAAAIDWNTAKVFEKLDGSLMSLYWYAGKWRVASSGTPDAGGNAHESAITFAELFWQTWHGANYALPDDTQMTYMFELMTPQNRIIVQHKQSRLVLIGARRLSDFAEEKAIQIAAKFGWVAVESVPLASLSACTDAATKLTGLDGEGFVVCDSGFHRIKVKCPKYVALSHMKDTLSPRSMLEVIRKGESDEFLNYFPEMRPVYESVRMRFQQLCQELSAEYAEVENIESQKDFANAIKTSRCSSALFALRNGKSTSLKEYFANATAPSVERAVGILAD